MNIMKRHFIFILLACAFLVPFIAYSQGQRVTVNGKVLDKTTGMTLPGVTVSSGVPLRPVGGTDGKGQFRVAVQDGATLVFSFIGFKQQRVKLSPGQTSVTVTLTEDNSQLEEVVVRGYVARSKQVSTGSSTVISNKDLQDNPVTNVDQLLQGKVAGLNVQVNTGAPGFRGSVQLRGLSTLSVSGNGSESFLQPTSPLYIIDGVPIDADKASDYGLQTQGPGISPTSLIPPEDIESIEILKDAQATSLYGSRGAYGVIIITTKRGNSETPRVRYTGNYYIQRPPQLRATIGGNAERHLKILQVMLNALSVDDLHKLAATPELADSLNAYYNNSTDWQGIFYQNAYNQTHNIAIDGGNPTFNYKTNLGYQNNTGIIKNTGFNRYSLNMNMEFRPNTKFRFFGSLFGAVGEQSKGDGSGLLQTGVAENGQASSLLPSPSFYLASSSVVSALQTKNSNNSRNLRANVEGRYEFIQGLALTANISYDYTSDTEDTFTPAAANSSFAQVYSFDGRSYTLYNRNNLSYSRTIGGDHNFFLNTFTEIYKQGKQQNITRQVRTPNDQLQGPVGYDAYNSRGGGVLTNYKDARIASIASAFSYDYKKKYVVDLSYRLDGTSSSGQEDPYSKNPAVGLRWNFWQEKWFQNSKWLNNGALRLSWGKNISPSGGLDDIYGVYDLQGTYNNNPVIGVDYDKIPNPNLKPTTTTQYNLGVDAGFFNSRLELTFDTYYKKVENMLFDRGLSTMTGFNKLKSNDVGLVDYGYELYIVGRPIRNGGKFDISLSANAAINRDVLTNLPKEFGGQTIKWDTDTRFQQHLAFRVGSNSLSNYMYINEGVYARDEDVPVNPVTGLRYRVGNEFFKAGDPIIKDLNGDYVLDENDYQITGNTQPLVTGGVSANIMYNKHWGLNIYASFTAKRTILNNALSDRLALMRDPFAKATAVPLNDLNVWRNPGDVAKYPNPFDYARYNNVQPFRKDQTLWAEDGSYFKLNNLTLSYMFDKKAIRRFGLYNLRIYFTTDNLFTISGYSGPNPENVTDLGRDNSDGYPVPRTYNLGINMELNTGK